MDKIIEKYFLIERLETWLQLLDNYPESKKIETEFMESQV